MRFALCLSLAWTISASAAEKVETIRLDPAPNMTRAELHFIKTIPNPKAVLILCPGCNGSGDGLIRSPEWIEFATKNRLGLVGLSFASEMEAIHGGTGYYYASKGSGEKLLEGIRQIYGRELPLLLYGFSGGAHFTSRFEEWKPEQVLAWCAYSAGWWDEPKVNAASPPGIVACGDADSRYGASMIYFKQGRAIDKPWLWVSLRNVGHTGSAELDDFVRRFFSMTLSPSKKLPVLVDIDKEAQLLATDGAVHPALTGWLPDNKLFDDWRKIHEP